MPISAQNFKRAKKLEEQISTAKLAIESGCYAFLFSGRSTLPPKVEFSFELNGVIKEFLEAYLVKLEAEFREFVETKGVTEK